MGLLAVIVTIVHTEPYFRYCIYLNWLEKAQEAYKAQWITPVYISSLRNCFLIAHRRITSMAIQVWFKPETTAKHVRKTECCFPFMFGKLFFSFLISSNRRYDFMNKSEKGNLSSPGHSHMAMKSEFYSQEGLWGSFGSLLIFV